MNTKHLQGAQNSETKGNEGGGSATATPQLKSNAHDGEDADDSSMMSGLLGAFGSTTLAATTATAKAKAIKTPKVKARPTKGGANNTSTPSTTPTPGITTNAWAELQSTSARRATSSDTMDQTSGNEDPSATTVPPRSKRGRVNPTVLAEQDEEVADNVKDKLHDLIGPSSVMPTSSECEMVAFCKTSISICNDVITQCNNKLAQMKRRKNLSNQDEAVVDKLKEFNQTASTFLKLFMELASAAPKASDLSTVMGQVEAHGYVCGRVAAMKLCKATLFDLVKYNRYSEIVEVAAKTWNKMDADDESDAKFFQQSIGLVVEQILQKLLQIVPQTQVKMSLPGAQSVKNVLLAINGDEHDSLHFTDVTKKQVSVLTMLFKSVDDDNLAQ